MEERHRTSPDHVLSTVKQAIQIRLAEMVAFMRIANPKCPTAYGFLIPERAIIDRHKLQ